MKKRDALILGVVLLTVYYCVLFYIAQCWYSNIPEVVERIMESTFYHIMILSAYAIVPIHLIGVTWLAYKRIVNAGQIVLLFMVPFGVAYFIFPAK